MTERNLIYYGNPILRQKAKKIHHFDAALPKLAQDMFETMHANDGVGLAAPQIGLSIRLIVVEGHDKDTDQSFKHAIANPEITKAEGQQIGIDGCLSIPGYYGINIRRSATITLKGQDPHGKPLRLTAHGYLAWALQHEIDHLNGILYIDHLNNPQDLRRTPTNQELEEAYNQQSP
jgi:peptide deformylase